MRRAAAAVAALGIAAAVLGGVSPAHADQIRDRQYWLSSYGITAAWNVTRGAGVTVAIIDTGVDGSHPDLTGSVIGGMDASGLGSIDGQTPVGPNRHHGTMVASLLAGRGHGVGNASGVIGVAPEARILSASVGFGVGDQSSDDQIAAAVRWAVDNGADIINMSLTRNTLEWPESWDEAFLHAMRNDVLVVAAAGNRGAGTTEVGAPATMPGVLVVGGVDRSGRASWDASSQGISISVSAPSEELVGAGVGGGYFQWAGTSGATPIVAGIAALVRSAHPELSAGGVIERITSTARPVSGVTLPSPIYGHGLVDAAAAVASSDVAEVTEPVELLTDWIRLHRRAATEPTPEPSFAPEPVAPTPTPETPRVDNPLGSTLPDPVALRDTGIPLLVYGMLAIGVGWWAWAFRRSVKGEREHPIE